MGASSTRHLTDAELQRLASGSDEPRLERHAAECRSCSGMLALFGLPRASGACPEPDRLAAFLWGRPEARSDAALQSHLSACTDCGVELDSLERSAVHARSLPRLEARAGLAPSLVELLARLIRLEPPASLAVVTRSGRAAGTGLDRSLADYRSGNYARAARRLEKTPGELLGAAGRFLLGVCQLLDERTGQSVAELEAAVKSAPRNTEYRWYLAQALLRSGRAQRALGELERIARVPGGLRGPARDAARELARLLRDEASPHETQ